jgi:hypothetical protein
VGGELLGGGGGGRGFEGGYQFVDRTFVLRVGEGEVAAILVEVACDRAADAAELVRRLRSAGKTMDSPSRSACDEGKPAFQLVVCCDRHSRL